MEKAINEVKKQGYTVIPNFVDSSTITKLKELCDSLPPCRGAVSAGWTLADPWKLPWLFYYTAQIHDSDILNLIKEKLSPICTDLLGPFTFRATDFIVNCSHSNRQKELIYRPHVDTPYRFWEFKDRTDLIGMQIAITIDELTEKNGGTAFVPGSHVITYDLNELGKNTDHEKYMDFFLDNNKQHIAPPGTLILWDGRLLHSTMPNTTDNNRRLLLINAVSNSVCDQLDKIDPIN